MRNWALKFVTNYIRRHMGHNSSMERNEIFKAIGEGISTEFYEDNRATRFAAVAEWLSPHVGK